MNIAAFLVTLPINLLMCYCIWKDIEEHIERKKRIEKKCENLLTDQIYLDISGDEKYMLDQLSKMNNEKNNQYIRSILKEHIKDIA